MLFVFGREQGFLHYPGKGWTLILGLPEEVALAPARARPRISHHFWRRNHDLGLGGLVYVAGYHPPIDRPYESGDMARGEVTWTTKEGRCIPVPLSCASLRDPGGALQGKIYLGQNISDLKQAEEALRESEQRLSTIVAYAPEAMTILDADTGRWVDVDPNAERLFGFDWQSLLSRGPIELSPVTQVDGRSSQEAACGYIEEALNDNAIKYARAGGVALKVGLQNGRVRFLVEDTGIGIKPEHLTEIFAGFHQVRDPRVAVEGTGLGLAISKRLVRLMGGELQVASSPGEGSRFWFSLDLPPASVPEERVVVGVEGDRRRVLVVDDEENGRNPLRDLLAPLGFEVHEARDGSEGVRAALSLKPNAILMDMRIPGLDGWQATCHIHASAHTLWLKSVGGAP